MSMSTRRRHFLKSTLGVSSLLGLGDFSFLARLNPVSADETRLDGDIVRFRPEIEPLVRLLEDTPRDKVLEEVGQRVQDGTSYRQVLAALLLAGIRNVQPRPAVGFKFHAVLVVNSAHLASMSSPASDRWLPIFWAIDEFKNSQAQDVREGNWTMSPVKESAVPTGVDARRMFVDAMDRWDEEAVDAAVAGLVRSAGANELFELFARYGARDFRSIGHKSIFVANSWRTLQCIGWNHAEPVLRSLAYALMNHEGEPNPADSDLQADRPFRGNLEKVTKIRDGWQSGRIDAGATSDLLATLRSDDYAAATDKVVDMLNRGVAPQSVHDGLFLAAGELLMRQPGIVALHAVTTTNAMHYAFQTVADDETRRLLLMQNASFLTMFREAMRSRGQVGADRVDQLEGTKIDDSGDAAVAEIFRDVSGDRHQAAGKVLAYLDDGRQPKKLIDAARRLVFLKGNNAHDYKFSSAVLEDYDHVSPQWRNRFLATSVFNLRGSESPDNGLVNRIRQAIA
jgi:hypothetical protein